MKVTQQLHFLYFLIFFVSLPSQASSPVWKVSKGDNYLYLGATIHMLGQNDYPLPDAFDKAYKDSSRLVFEADFQKLQSPEYSKFFMKKLMYPGNKTIKSVLDENTFKALDNYFVSRGLTLEKMLKFKPGVLSMMMTVFELQRLNIAGVGVDEFYLKQGISDGKKLSYLESVDEQLSFIGNMGSDNANEFISYTLNDMDEIADKMAAIKHAWRKGDNTKLKEVALNGWEKDFPEIYSIIMVKRNHKWIPKIESMLKTKEIEFVLFGALHMVGDNGVLDLLRNRGYTIQKQ